MDNIGDEAKEYIKKHKKELCDRFANREVYPPIKDPVVYFMAGSPGAGKTEYSKAFIEQLYILSPERKIVRIDTDEVRDFIPQYNGKNANLVQGAAALGVEKLIDCVIANNQDFLLDSMFADYDISYKNVKRCIKHGRKISILYIYQDPIEAWDITKKREKLEGRPVPKETFIKSLFNAKQNVEKIKKEFPEIELTLIIKNAIEKFEKPNFNIDNIDNYLKIPYTEEKLNLVLK